MAFTRAPGVETFFVAIILQWRVLYQTFPGLSAERCRPVCSIGDERVQGGGWLLNLDELCHQSDLHSQTDLRERRGPVGGEFGFLIVQSCQPVCLVVRFFVGPQWRVVSESWLHKRHIHTHTGSESIVRIIFYSRVHESHPLQQPFVFYLVTPFHSQEWSISNFSCSLTRTITSRIM